MAYIDSEIGQSEISWTSQTVSGTYSSSSSATESCFAAEITSDGVGLFLVREGKKIPMRIAESLLLQPSDGDICLVWLHQETAWIIAILKRQAASAAQVLLPENAVVKSKCGSVAIRANSVSLESVQVNLKSTSATVTVDQISLAAHATHLTVSTLKTVASYISTVAQRILQHSQMCSRTVTGIDRTDGAVVEINAEQLVRIKGQHTLVEAEQLIKARGAQIHFG